MEGKGETRLIFPFLSSTTILERAFSAGLSAQGPEDSASWNYKWVFGHMSFLWDNFLSGVANTQFLFYFIFLPGHC